MRILHDEVRNNKILTYFVMLLFIVVIGILGLIIGYVMGNWLFGALISSIVAILYSLIAFATGSKMVLSMNKARPATKQEFPFLVNTVEGLSIAAGIPTPKTYVIDSEALNAFATGMRPEDSYVVVTTGLLSKMNRQELEGVLAHEISHIKNYDIRVMLISAVLAGIIVFLSQVLIRMAIYGGGSKNKDNKAGIFLLIFGIVFLILSPIFAEMIKLAISRKREYLADASAAVITRYPEGLASALEKIKNNSIPLKQATKATSHLYIYNPFKKSAFSNLFSTHPPVDQRIKRLREMH